MPYIPRYRPFSPQEIAYGPTMMRAQHDALEANQEQLGQDFKFDHLDQDRQFIEEPVKGYSKRVNDLSSTLAKEGFSHFTKGDLTKLRKEFQNDGLIADVKKNYADANQSWQQAKASITKDSSPAYMEKAKQAHFANYKGARGDDGERLGFNPGAVVGEIDVADDAVKYFNNAGFDMADVSKLMPELKFNQVKTPWGGMIYQTIMETPGTPGATNRNNLRTAMNEYIAQYANPESRRGTYATIDGKSQEDIIRTLTNTASMMGDTKGGSPGRISVSNYNVNPPQSSQSSTRGSSAPVFPTVQVTKDLDPSLEKTIQKDEELLSTFDPTFTPTKFNAKGDFGEDIVDPRDTHYTEQKERYDFYKKKYANLVPLFGEGKEFIDAAIYAHRNTTAFADSKANFSNYDVYKDILQKANTFVDDGKIFEKEGDSDNKKTIEQITGELPQGTNLTGRGAWMDSDGNVLASLPTGKKGKYETWKINGLPPADSKIRRTLSNLKKDFNDYSLEPEEIKQINNRAWPIGENTRVWFKINPENPLERQVYIQTKDTPLINEATGEVVGYDWNPEPQSTTLSQLQQLAILEKNEILKIDRTK